ncbi:MAG: T9SS C-terminal target domain-containing protein [Calditrichaeota bacterium]|nr:MAG: T9SS C-terminal target domain-containing protein [Calditrichota bacterium]
MLKNCRLNLIFIITCALVGSTLYGQINDIAIQPHETGYLSLQVESQGVQAGNLIGLSSGPRYILASGLTATQLFFPVKLKQEERINTSPNSFALHQNFPNPFNPETTIKFDIAMQSSSANPFITGETFVTLKIYNLAGQEINTLLQKNLISGEYSILWDGKNYHGHAVPSGLYIYVLRAGNLLKSQKMLLLK